MSRRSALQSLGALGALASIARITPAYARSHAVIGAPAALTPRLRAGAVVHELAIAESRLRLDGRAVVATTINGTVPGPLLRLPRAVPREA